MRKGQIVCGFACAGIWRSWREASDPDLKERRRAIMRKAGAASAKARMAKVRAKLEETLEGKTLAEAWHLGYETGYSAGWYRGAHDTPSSRSVRLIGYARQKRPA
jgi:hypothetical protein